MSLYNPDMEDQPERTESVSTVDLAQQLEPAICEACDGRLGKIRWFQADWQRGGAATGYATLRNGESDEREVVVKVPVGPMEHRFTTGLGGVDAPTPRIGAAGNTLGGYDLAWLVIEKIDGQPLSREKGKTLFRELATAAAGFYARSRELWKPEGVMAEPHWEVLIATARKNVKTNGLPEEQRWNNALKRVQKSLTRLADRWESRPVTDWCHGDLHPGNAMRRADGSAWGEPMCVLIDLANVHPGHWVEDAVYLERIFWGREHILGGARPMKLLAKARKDAGLENGDEASELAIIRRVLLAACVPAFLEREGHPAYLAASLERLEELAPRVCG